jgi:ribose/xylose/arabinose/galactoside ABC-type transport system permease subunit
MTMERATSPVGVAIPQVRRPTVRIEWRLIVLVAAMTAIAALFGSFNPYYLSWQNALDICRQGALLAITALGVNLVIVCGEIDLSVGAVVGLVSVAVPAFFDLGLPTPVVVVLALLLGAAAGLANGLIVLRLLVPSFLATLGTMAIYRGLAIHISNQPRAIYDDTFVSLFGTEIAGLSLTIYYPILIAIALALLWRYSRFGVRVRAVGSNEQSARFAGLATGRIKLAAFVLAGVFASAGALVLLGRTQTGLAVAGDGLELNAIAAVILGGGRLGGGKGSVIGTLLGAYLLTMMFSGIAGMGLTAAWHLIVKGLILVVVIILMRK